VKQAERWVKRAVGHFNNLLAHSLKPYEPTPEHLRKRLLIPLCKDIQEILRVGTTNDIKEALHQFSKVCQRIL